MAYDPTSIDTSSVSLPPELLDLSETLAKNTHDLWAQQRLADGWRYGVQRDDQSREHPCLVPYEELPDSEKQYDRITTMESLKLLVALGCKIETPSVRLCSGGRDPAGRPATDAVPDLDANQESAVQSALRSCAESIMPLYEGANGRAIRFQRRHRCTLVLAAACGTLAILLAILQLAGFLHSIRSAMLEVGVAFIAFSAVVLGLIAAFQRQWLLERHKAERYQLLRFTFLLNPASWPAAGAGQASLSVELANAVKEIRDLDFNAIEPWMNGEAPQRRPFLSAGARSINDAAISALIAYYRTERLSPQIEYARYRANRNAWLEHFTRHIAPGLFFLSVLAVFGHFACDYLSNTHGAAISTYLIVLAAGLPAIGAGFRTFRAASEFSRNSCRFRAMHLALVHLDNKLLLNLDRQEALDCIRHCERILESEHREWLRLMAEAEWYG